MFWLIYRKSSSKNPGESRGYEILKSIYLTICSYRHRGPSFPRWAKRSDLGRANIASKSQIRPGWRVGRVHDLASFIRASFEIYEKYPQEFLVAARLNEPGYVDIKSHVKIGPVAKEDRPLSPYSGLADYQFCRGVIQRTPLGSVDPVVAWASSSSKKRQGRNGGQLLRSAYIAHARSSGLNYYVAELTPAGNGG